MKPGAHRSAQALADRFTVSRSPVGEALKLLAKEGTLAHVVNKGFFVSTRIPKTVVRTEPIQSSIDAAYFALANDRLEQRIENVVSAAYLKERYNLSSSEVQTLCTRIVKEGWLERRAGYGYQFTDMLNSPEALAQTYRFRMAMEPAALLEPGYLLDRTGAEECKKVELHIIEGGVETMSIEELYDRGVKFQS